MRKTYLERKERKNNDDNLSFGKKKETNHKNNITFYFDWIWERKKQAMEAMIYTEKNIFVWLIYTVFKWKDSLKLV